MYGLGEKPCFCDTLNPHCHRYRNFTCGHAVKTGALALPLLATSPPPKAEQARQPTLVLVSRAVILYIVIFYSKTEIEALIDHFPPLIHEHRVDFVTLGC